MINNTKTFRKLVAESIYLTLILVLIMNFEDIIALDFSKAIWIGLFAFPIAIYIKLVPSRMVDSTVGTLRPRRILPVLTMALSAWFISSLFLALGMISNGLDYKSAADITIIMFISFILIGMIDFFKFGGSVSYSALEGFKSLAREKR